MRHALARFILAASMPLALLGCGARVDPKWANLPPLTKEPFIEQDAEIQRLKEQASKSPQSKPAVMALALAFQERGRPFEAAGAYQSMLRQDPLDDRAASGLLEEAEIYGVSPRVVADLCAAILARDKSNRGALWVLGELLLKQNQIPAARADLERAWEQQPRYWRPALTLARVAGLQGQAPEALEWCRRVEQTAPDTWEAKAQLAMAYGDAGDMDRALGAARAAVALGPRYPLPQTILAKALLSTRRPAEAAEATQRAISLAPQIPTNAPSQVAGYFATKQRGRYWLLGQAYRALGRRDEARNALAKAVDDNQAGEVPAGANLDAALMYQQVGDRQKAIEQYRRAIEKGIDLPAAYNNLAYLYAEDGHHLDEALDAAQTAVDLAPGPVTHDTLGWVQYQRGDYQAAAQNLGKAAAAAPRQPEILHHLGLTYVRVGKAAEARDTLNRALALLRSDDAASRELRTKIERDLQRREIRDAGK